jgi:hypothetical protein
LQSNLVATGLDETEDHARRIENPGNVGLESCGRGSEMRVEDLATFINEMAGAFNSRFPECAEDLRSHVAFSGLYHALRAMAVQSYAGAYDPMLSTSPYRMDMITVPRDAKFTRETCSHCHDVVYRQAKP